MQKYTFILLLLCSTTFCSAQITYTHASFPQAGDVLEITAAVDSMTVSAASAVPQNWNFSALVAVSTTLDTIQAASTGTNFASFPNTEIRQSLVAGLGGTAYVDVDTAGMTRVGGGLELLGFSFVSPYINPHIIQEVPFSYPNTASDDYKLAFAANIDSIPFLRDLLDSAVGSFSSAADSIRVAIEGEEIREVDAFGTCIMSDTTYNVLRQKVLNIVTVKIEMHIDPQFFNPYWQDVTSLLGSSLPVPLPSNDSTIYYDHLAEGITQPIVRLRMDPTNTYVANVEYLQGDTSSTININYLENEIEATIFPNPTDDYINIELGEQLPDGYDWNLVDMTGRVIGHKQAVMETNHVVSTRALPNGYYILVMRNHESGAIIKREKVGVFR